MRTRFHRASVPTAALAAVLALLAGCGGGDSSPEAAAPPPAAKAGAAFNPTDVMFAQMMVPHHKQGIDIVRLAATKARNAEVKTLAAAIETTQASEADTMAGWLRGWGKPATAPADEHAAHGGMPGTSAPEIAAVGRTAPAQFDRAFLNLLIAHQDDAIQLARAETASGRNPDAKALAKRIDESRSAQITQMLALLNRV